MSAALEQVARDLLEVVAFYADPDTYFAVAFMFDPPCGDFLEDFDAEHGSDFYQREMPGAKAREVLRRHAAVLQALIGADDA